MGYTTDFTGAFRITPKLDPAIACRMNLWLNSRHYQRLPFMKAQGIDASDDNLLFGMSNMNIMYFMPSFQKAVENLMSDGINPALAPHCIGNTMTDCKADQLFTMSNVTKELNRAYNMTPGNIPSLWSNIYLVNDPDNDQSFLGWNQSEKSYNMAQWISAITALLQNMGYHVTGCIEAQGEEQEDHWFMEVLDTEDLAMDLGQFAYELNVTEQQNEHKCVTVQEMVNALNNPAKVEQFIQRLFELMDYDYENTDLVLSKLTRYKKYGTEFHLLDSEAGIMPTYQQEYMTAISHSEKAAKNTFEIPAIKKLLSNSLSNIPMLTE